MREVRNFPKTEFKIILRLIFFDGAYEIFPDKKVISGDGLIHKWQKKLNLTIIDINELIQNSLQETKSYLKEIHKFIEIGDKFSSEDIDRISSGLHWLINIFYRIDNIYNYGKHFNSKDFNFSDELIKLDKLKDIIEKNIQLEEYDKINDIIKSDLQLSINKWFNNIDKMLTVKSPLPEKLPTPISVT